MPVKNEVDLLPITLGIISEYCDTIIIADQMSNDGSREIYKKFPKVRMIENTRTGHSNEIRWDLLKVAREYGDNNLILCLDADEYIPVALFNKFFNKHDFKVGESFRFPWIQLWRSVDFYNNTGVWYRNYQRIAWMDDGKTDYNNEIVINDHTSRVPSDFLSNCKRIDNIPIIHLQWVSWEKTQLKQAWYRCVELVKNPRNYVSINASYSLSLDNKNTRLSKVPTEWIDNYESLKWIENFPPTWHLQYIYNLFDKYGILFFEPLQIWHISDLKQEFIKITGRKPVSISEKYFFEKIKNIKRSLIKLIHY